MSIEALSSTTQNKTGTRPQRSPPRNKDGEIICEHDECKDEQPIFRRLCEYNKHMDKHERPYKCSNPACRKNPGFTYAGGLLRHQREVHSMHRTKDPFYCPHNSCNRSAGAGFSRRENLEEHLRRRHSGISIDDTIDQVATHSHKTCMPSVSEPQQHTAHGQHQLLESLPSNRKRPAETTEADDIPRGLDNHAAFQREEDNLRSRVAILQQDNDRIRAELFRRDQLLTDMAQENKRLRGMLATLPPLPAQAMYHHPPMT